MAAGGCHCGGVRSTVSGEPEHSALCHCRDCTHHAGAQMVGWAMFPEDAVTVTGTASVYASSEHGHRHFRARCGTGLFHTGAPVFRAGSTASPPRFDCGPGA